jgi:UDP-MurNAc hydroxylase
MRVIFNNHASVTVKTKDISILTDPWFNGSAFNDGWNLIHENNENEEFFLHNINFIWISHEHPDHFQPKFFINNKNFIIKNNIKIIFQKTKDKRVINFLKKLNFDVIEIDEKKKIKLSEYTEIILFKAEFYDSSIAIVSDNQTLLNLNDCQYDEKELKEIKKNCGKIDLLLTQFSYAAWKGGEDNLKWRQDSASKKLKTIEKQYNILNSKCLIPFASFIYFSHRNNFYMNDSINNIEKVSSFLQDKNITFKVLKPNESFEVNTPINNKNSQNFWNNEYKKLKDKKLNDFNESFQLNKLNNEFVNYRVNIFKKNNQHLMKLLSKIKFLNLFQPINLYLFDLKIKVTFNIFSKNLKICDENIDKKKMIKLHSSSLYFIFKNEFGFDTLSVNAMFESDFQNFKKMVFNFAIGSYNAAGMYIQLSSIFNFKIYLLVIKKIKTIKLQF